MKAERRKNIYRAQLLRREQKLSQFLLRYRVTPHATTGVSPVELFLKHSVRTRLDLLKLSVLETVADKQLVQKKYHDKHSRVRSFEKGLLAVSFPSSSTAVGRGGGGMCSISSESNLSPPAYSKSSLWKSL